MDLKDTKQSDFYKFLEDLKLGDFGDVKSSLDEHREQSMATATWAARNGVSISLPEATWPAHTLFYFQAALAAAVAAGQG